MDNTLTLPNPKPLLRITLKPTHCIDCVSYKPLGKPPIYGNILADEGNKVIVLYMDYELNRKNKLFYSTKTHKIYHCLL